LSVKAAVTVKDTVQKKLDDDRKKKSPMNSPTSPHDVKNVHAFERALNKSNGFAGQNQKKNVRSEHYVSDDSTSYDDR